MCAYVCAGVGSVGSDVPSYLMVGAAGRRRGTSIRMPFSSAQHLCTVTYCSTHLSSYPHTQPWRRATPAPSQLARMRRRRIRARWPLGAMPSLAMTMPWLWVRMVSSTFALRRVTCDLRRDLMGSFHITTDAHLHISIPPPRMHHAVPNGDSHGFRCIQCRDREPGRR
jgi:hypothetical protein